MSLLAFVTEFPSPAQRAEKLLALNERTAPCGLRLSARMPLRSSAAAKKRCAARDALNGATALRRS